MRGTNAGFGPVTVYMSVGPTKKNRRGSKLRGNVEDQYLGKVKFILRKKKFWTDRQQFLIKMTQIGAPGLSSVKKNQS